MLLVDLGEEVVGRPDALVTAVDTLQVMDRSVALGDSVLGKPRYLELAIDVTGVDVGTVRQAFANSSL